MNSSKKEIVFSLVIVIPCFNEEQRLCADSIISFIQRNKTVGIIFINDRSTDLTLQLLEKIRQVATHRIFIKTHLVNKGKSASVRSGFLFANSSLNCEKIAYLDADLSTSLEECLQLSTFIDSKIAFVFGSRISKIDTTIDRRFKRFIAGRIIATLISMQLGLTVYDTQCGCKIFRADIAKLLFHEQFLSRWLFDVEIFHRLIQLIGKNSMKHTVREIPLNRWVDTPDSKVKPIYFFRLWFDLIRIAKKYKKKEKVVWKSLPQNTF